MKNITNASCRIWVNCHLFCKKTQKSRHFTQTANAGVIFKKGYRVKTIFIVLNFLVLIGCGNSSDSNNSSLLELQGTTWSSPSCTVDFGRVGKHEIRFTSEAILFEFTFYTDGCDLATEDPEKINLSRPYSIGKTVVMESGVKANEIVITTQVYPSDEQNDYIFDILDYIYASGDSLYFADKTYENCLKQIDITSETVRNLGCEEWSPIIDFDYVYTKKI
tara:strand:- start:137 stop:796 length:660 start_codon:yes stop_codon:yes gene_type:complete